MVRREENDFDMKKELPIGTIESVSCGVHFVASKEFKKRKGSGVKTYCEVCSIEDRNEKDKLDEKMTAENGKEGFELLDIKGSEA